MRGAELSLKDNDGNTALSLILGGKFKNVTNKSATYYILKQLLDNELGLTSIKKATHFIQ